MAGAQTALNTEKKTPELGSPEVSETVLLSYTTKKIGKNENLNIANGENSEQAFAMKKRPEFENSDHYKQITNSSESKTDFAISANVAVGENFHNGLQSKESFGSVAEQRKRPELVGTGLNKNILNSCLSAKNGQRYNPILSDEPNLYKHNGMFVQNSGYFKIPRSITQDPRYKSARLKYQKVLHVILEHAAFSKTKHAISNNLIEIEPGQLCITERHLVKLCNEDVAFEEDMIDKNIARRAIHFWRRCHFVNQEVRHGKTIITIIVKGLYDENNTLSEPQSEPKVNQDRTTKEEDKEEEEERKKEKSPSSSKPLRQDIAALDLSGGEKNSLEQFDPDVIKISYKNFLKAKDYYSKNKNEIGNEVSYFFRICSDVVNNPKKYEAKKPYSVKKSSKETQQIDHAGVESKQNKKYAEDKLNELEVEYNGISSYVSVLDDKIRPHGRSLSQCYVLLESKNFKKEFDNLIDRIKEKFDEKRATIAS